MVDIEQCQLHCIVIEYRCVPLVPLEHYISYVCYCDACAL